MSVKSLAMRFLVLALLLSACAHESAAQYADRQTAELRAEFPPGKTSRAEVLAKNGHAPEIVLTRPDTGWTSRLVLDAEQRTGASIARAEKYVSPTGTSGGFLTLAHVWYFYDGADVLVDVVWERMGD